MPPKHNKRQSANSRDKRHENGLAAPGKQIKKRKSNGHINGATVVKDASVQVLGSGAHALNDHTASYTTAVQEQGNDEDTVFAHAGTSAVARSQSSEDDSAAIFESDLHNHREANGSLDSPAGHGQITEASQSHWQSRESTAHDEPTATVIGAHSLGDVIAILLLLLQLPSTMLIVVQLCFAIMTFSVPSGSWSPFSLFTISDWFQGYAGSPSLWTTVGVDVFAASLWSMSSQERIFVLDYAQAVIAISLGGGASGKGRLHSVACFAIISASHLYRLDTVRQRCLDLIWDTLTSTNMLPWFVSSTPPLLAGSPLATRTFPHALLELHIIVQGIIRTVRRALRPLELKTPNHKHLLTDTSTHTSTPPSMMTTDRSTEGGRNLSTDGRPPGPPPLTQEAREKCATNGKRRRKQATLVRSSQPFWAAIANTKVTVSKEIEQSQVSRDAFEANAADANHLGDAIERCSEERVWITQIGDTEVHFATFAAQVQQQTSSTDDVSYRQQVLPIRVNGASWTSTWDHRDEPSERTLARGKIFGLTPSTSYFIQFFSFDGGKLLYSANLLTRPIASSDPGKDSASSSSKYMTTINGHAGVALVPPPSTLRPSSPTTTLRCSITATDARLQEYRNQLKKNRRDHRNSNTTLRKEVDTVESRLSSFGGNDDRQRQRRFQYQQNIRQAQDTTSELITRLENLGEIPEIELHRSAETKMRWQEAVARQTELHDSVSVAKVNGQKDIVAARTENASLQQKRERLQARLNKLSSQRDQLALSNAQRYEHQTVLQNERADLVSQRQGAEQNYVSMIQRMESELHELENLATAYDQQIQAIEASLSTSYMQGHQMVPQTPEHTMITLGPSSRPQPNLSNSVTFQAPVGTPPPGQSRRGSSLPKIGGNANRARSSSMLSNISAFTDAEAGSSPTNGDHPYLRKGSVSKDETHVHDRSEGSGSPYATDDHVNERDRHGSPSSVARWSPIGKEVGRGSPRNTKA